MKRPAYFLSGLFCLVFTQAFAQSPRTGKDYAVFFYVTDFQQGWAPLPETKPEALAIQKELKDNYGFQCETVANPRKTDILNKLRDYNDRLTANDQLLLFFSMHGHYEENADRGYLIAKDGLLNDDYGSSWLSYDDLSAYLARCKAKHVLLALDACHSGAFGIRNKSRPDLPDYLQGDDCLQSIAKMFQYSGRQYCSSGNKDAKSPAKSLFASRFLEALRKGWEQDFLRFDDLEYYIGRVENPKPESGTFKGHVPGGDFVFVRTGGCVTQRSGSVKDNTVEEQTWKIAQKLGDGKVYLEDYPNGKYAALAKDLNQRQNQADKSLPPDALFELMKCGYRADDMVLIKGGTFQMGSDTGQIDEKPVHTVTVSDFYLCKTEVTVAQFKAFVDDSNYNVGNDTVITFDPETYEEFRYRVGWQYSIKGEIRPYSEYNYPVIYVSWNDALAYCEWLSKKTGAMYRLPTEAEWEYAAGGGAENRTLWAGTSDENNILRYANVVGDQDGYSTLAPVGSFQPNTLGLYDMSGNVLEWCSDIYGTYSSKAQINPISYSGSETRRVGRGGAWQYYSTKFSSVTSRESEWPDRKKEYIGFRIVRSK